MEDAANPIVADKALGGQISELAGELGSPPVVFEGSDLQKDPVLSNFLDQLSGSVKKRSVREYEGEMQQVRTQSLFMQLFFWRGLHWLTSVPAN